jgi:S-formylglutathione hydrolase FrmB
MSSHNGGVSVSLLSGWLPWALRAGAAGAVVAAVWRADRRWWTRRAPVAAGVAALLAIVLAVVVDAALGQQEPLPAGLWFWFGVAMFALVVAVLPGRVWQRLVALGAVVLAVATVGSALNAFVGYYPTVGDAVGELTGQPVSGQVDADGLGSVSPETSTGRVVAVDIPDTYSHFAHRTEFVYLPPAWFRSGRKPRLPVIELIGAEFASPDNWIRAGGAVTTADAYARAHDGRAPIMVFADASGGFSVDTECVDGPHGNAETHLDADIPAYVDAHFHAAPGEWAVAGWSMGGTCAIDLAVEHPELYHRFLDISGDLGPNTGDRAETVARLFGGDASAWAAHDPLTVLGRDPHYVGVTGVFADGAREHRTTHAARRLAAACRRDGIDTVVVVRPGGHTWQFAEQEFAALLPALLPTPV